jgi:hypothetical protein
MNIKIGSCCSGGSCSATGSTSRQSSINFFDAVAYDVGTTILPVDFLKVSGKSANGVNHLKWTVIRQANVVQYVVEKSSYSSGPFISVYTTAAKTRDQETITYTYSDENVAATSFYRIRAVDKDGQSSSSGIIRVSSSAMHSNFVMVNDGRSRKVKFQASSTKEEEMMLTITDYSGRLLYKGNLIIRSGANLYTVDEFTLPRAGMYFIQLLNASGARYTGKISAF